MNKFFALSLGLLMTAMVGGIYAEAPHAPRGPYPNVHSLDKFKEALNLSESQVQRIDVLNKSFREKHQVNHEKLKPLEDRVRELEKSGSVDYAAMTPLVKEISEIRAMERLDKIKHRNELMSILTPEQKSALQAKKAAHREKMKERKEAKEKSDH